MCGGVEACTCGGLRTTSGGQLSPSTSSIFSWVKLRRLHSPGHHFYPCSHLQASSFVLLLQLLYMHTHVSGVGMLTCACVCAHRGQRWDQTSWREGDQFCSALCSHQSVHYRPQTTTNQRWTEMSASVSQDGNGHFLFVSSLSRSLWQWQKADQHMSVSTDLQHCF